jgi:hypothetical protein
MRSGLLAPAPTFSKRALMMIRSLFDIRDDQELYPDEDGIEFFSQLEAEIDAAHTLAGLARDLAGQDDRRMFSRGPNGGGSPISDGTARAYEARAICRWRGGGMVYGSISRLRSKYARYSLF